MPTSFTVAHPTLSACSHTHCPMHSQVGVPWHSSRTGVQNAYDPFTLTPCTQIVPASQSHGAAVPSAPTKPTSPHPPPPASVPVSPLESVATSSPPPSLVSTLESPTVPGDSLLLEHAAEIKTTSTN